MNFGDHCAINEMTGCTNSETNALPTSYLKCMFNISYLAVQELENIDNILIHVICEPK
uniref:Uncharacterized protein n=1 Tax=Arundo donax TaxID=35708 RepID=A0A0A8YDR5_ARUDO